MRNLLSLSAEKLLGIRETEPERLFSNNRLAAKDEYHTLVKRWHPDHDHTKTAEDVFKHVAILYRHASERLGNGDWKEPAEKIEDEEPGVIKLRSTDKTKSLKIIRYVKHVPFELGDTYIGNTIVAYVVKNDFADLFEDARKRIVSLDNLPFKTAEMKSEIMTRYMPHIESVFYTTEKCVMVVRKPLDLIRFKDVVDHLGGKIDPRHVAWMVNTALNIACFLSWAKLTHNDISLDTYYISPEFHSGALLGGWWFSAPIGAKPNAVPSRTLRFAPPSFVHNKRADVRVDLELIKAMGREMLGDVTGMSLVSAKAAPQQMIDWLRTATSGDAIRDYDEWRNHVLPTCFGKRRFLKLDLNHAAIYGE